MHCASPILLKPKIVFPNQLFRENPKWERGSGWVFLQPACRNKAIPRRDTVLLRHPTAHAAAEGENPNRDLLGSAPGLMWEYGRAA